MWTALSLPPHQFYVPYIFRGVRFILALLFAYLATLLVERLVRAIAKYAQLMMRKRGGGSDYELEKRAATIGGITRKSLVVLIWAAGVLMAVNEIGFDVRPLLAGAGIIGLAVGFGAQNLVKDILAGMFLLLENQLRVNDVAVINGTGGLVEEINLRTTVLRGENGAVHVFPNGSIQSLSNMTREFSYYVFELPMPYKEDTDRVIAALKTIADQLAAEDPYRAFILDSLEILGVDRFADAGIIIKARIKTVPMKQWAVGREMNRRLKKEFESQGIGFPFPSQRLVLENTESNPLSFDARRRAELKTIIREVLKEAAQD